MASGAFYDTATAPATLAAEVAALDAFVRAQQAHSRNVVLVTSGGTTVPLEKETVRFLDNFSSGMRGAISAELFLSLGYAVIFLHRQHSLRPFERQLQTATQGHFIDVFHLDETGQAVVRPSHRETVNKAVQGLKKAHHHHAIHYVSFVSVNDYLFLLRGAAFTLAPLGASALLYLAAAVSDFYLPEDQMVEHKIQSSGAPLRLELAPVPKVLGLLKREWAPHSFVVSFKLETDPSLLLPKATQSLQKYHHDLVIGNVLKTRKHEVTLVHPGGAVQVFRLDDAQSANGAAEIEQLFVAELAQLHGKFQSEHASLVSRA